MGEVEVKGRQTGAEGGCRGRQASGEPAAVLPSTPMTLVGHDAEPAPALKQPRHGVGTSGDPAPRGRESESESGLRDQLPGPFAGSGGRRGAVRGAENSPRRREGMEERAAPRGARTSGQAGQEQAGAPGTLSPKAPRSLTLPGAE